MDRNFISINPNGGLSIRNGSQVISLSSNGLSISSDQNPLAQGDNNMNPFRSMFDDNPFGFMQSPGFPFPAMFGGMQPPNLFQEALPTQQVTTRNNYGVVTSTISTPTFFSQQTITTGAPTRTTDPLDLTAMGRPVEDPFSGLFPMPVPFGRNPLSFLIGRGAGAGEEPRQEQGLTREQIAGLNTSVYEDRQKEGPSRIKSRNGITKKPKEEPKGIARLKQKPHAGNNRANLQGQNQVQDHPEVHIIEPDVEEIKEINQSEMLKAKADGLQASKEAAAQTAKESNHEDSGPTSNGTCAICIGDYKKGDKLRVMPCEHKFHTECIDKWLVVKNACPVCKRKPVESAQPMNAAPRDPSSIGNGPNTNNVLFSVTVNSGNPLNARPPNMFDFSNIFSNFPFPEQHHQRMIPNPSTNIPNAMSPDIIFERSQRRNDMHRNLSERRKDQNKPKK